MLNGFPDNFRMGDDDVLDEFRRKQANFDLEEKRNEINNSRSLFVGALAGLAMAAVVGWFVLAPQYRDNGEEEVPVIRRPQEEIKIQPADPGNIDISNQEKTVYDIIERKPENAEVANVLPPAEQPDAEAIEALIGEVSVQEPNPPAAAEPAIKAESLAAPVKETAQPAAEKAETAIPAPALPATPSAPVNEEKNKTAPETTKPAENTAAPEPVKAEPAKPAVAKPAAAEKAVEKEKPAKTANTTIAKGAWQIQLMSSPNRKAVEKSWKTMVSKYDLLSGLPYEISSADLGAKGTYYRLKAGNFATRKEAADLCNKLKAAGGSCFTARK